MWSSEFEQLVRSHLQLDDAEPLAPDAELADHGLDSMETVNLLIEMEETFAITFPDELLGADTFRTPRALWGVLSDLLPAAR